MTKADAILIISSLAVGFFHTLTGPDHYLPFIVLGTTRKWDNKKTAFVVIICGLGHILSSVLLGLFGIALGAALTGLLKIESARGEIASWLLIGLGLAYMIWGIRQSYKNKAHSHLHNHENTIHDHNHDHHGTHIHVHETDKKSITPWVLFLVFVFGPCEPLIPLLMYPSANQNYLLIGTVAIVFGLATISAMLVMTFLGIYGISLINPGSIERHIHALAGLTILLCGVAIKWLGL